MKAPLRARNELALNQQCQDLVIMKTEAIATYLMRYPQTSEEQPFGPDVDVYKVAGKIFAIVSPEDDPPAISLKCDPIIALELREEYDAVTPGYHLNKDHWNTIALNGNVPDRELKKMIAHSYEQVVAGLPKALRLRISRVDWPSV
jgi:predicted DNA-binding protein (MmcQ/YjbR family)